MFDAGCMMENGWGTAPDAVGALALYRAAAEMGCIVALLQIGNLLEAGATGVAIDLPESARSFLSAAEEGDASGAYTYGRFCSYGRGVRVNGKKALRWLQFAVDSGELSSDSLNTAYREMGRILICGIGGVRPDERKAECCLVAAADAGDVEAAFTLVGLLGVGGPWRRGRIDKVAARKWAQRAIALGKEKGEVDELLEVIEFDYDGEY
jgi:TPR repeat protein